MKSLLEKYSTKLVRHGLCAEGEPLLGGYDAIIEWNKDSVHVPVFEQVFGKLSINSILFAKPLEPFCSILDFLSEQFMSEGSFSPDDTETRTFLHSIPVTSELSVDKVVESLKTRKSLVILNMGIVTFGTVTPEQAFVTFSSVCFSAFVKFMTDYYYDYKSSNVSSDQQIVFEKVVAYYTDVLNSIPGNTKLAEGPFNFGKDILTAMNVAGKKLVEYHMVDSFFGNISYRKGNSIYISQTGSSLDELEGCIDEVAVDGSSCNGITASSEFSAHRDVLLKENYSCILHGHPKFSVVTSMLCDDLTCDNRGVCYKKCSRKREAGGASIITGEVGTGPTGLSRTLPGALSVNSAVIVYGHGLFSCGVKDFNHCLELLIETEKKCFDSYLSSVGHSSPKSYK